MKVMEWEFDVRELPKGLQRTDHKDFFRVYASAAIMQTLGLEKDDLCELKVSGHLVGTALVWETMKGIKTKEIQISKQLLSLYEIPIDGKVLLSKMNADLPSANSIVLYEVPWAQSRDTMCIPSEHVYWAWLLDHDLYRAETISPGMLIENVTAKGQKRSFKIRSVNGSRNAILYRFHSGCEVQVVSDEVQSDSRDLAIPQGELGGLETQVKKLNKLIAPFGQVNDVEPNPQRKLSWSNGIILHGPPGTGKSLLLGKIGEAGWRTVVNINTDVVHTNANVGEKTTAIRKLFAKARSAQPSVILIDDLIHLIGSRDSQSSGDALALREALRHEMLRLEGSRTLVVATTRSLMDIDETLMRVETFPHVIEIPVPDKDSRAFILKVMSGLPKSDKNACIDYISSHTLGFVGADLKILLLFATVAADDRTGLDTHRSILPDIERIENHDIDTALGSVKPAAMRGVFIQTTETKWSDIGGQEEVKHFLNRALCRASKQNFARRPKKGLLLYGPPGCSKTMVARAAATESGHNFIAVKGAELLNMYVGESERKLRECFHLARSVAPSILFFDEFDAIGTDRGSGQHSGVNLVTTLLNEMDGIEELKDVFVLAATNKPDRIDVALTRAGRFDQMLYVGPPDLGARRQILLKHLQNSALADEFDTEALAKATDGYSGAELVNVCYEAIDAAEEESAPADQLTKLYHKHFMQALKQTKTVITPDLLAYFETFRASQRSGTM